MLHAPHRYDVVRATIAPASKETRTWREDLPPFVRLTGQTLKRRERKLLAVVAREVPVSGAPAPQFEYVPVAEHVYRAPAATLSLTVGEVRGLGIVPEAPIIVTRERAGEAEALAVIAALVEKFNCFVIDEVPDEFLSLLK